MASDAPSRGPSARLQMELHTDIGPGASPKGLSEKLVDDLAQRLCLTLERNFLQDLPAM